MSFFFYPPPHPQCPLGGFSEFAPNLGAWVVVVQYCCETLAGLELPRLFA